MDDAATHARSGRRVVEGARDMNTSRITWRGYGVNDPDAAASEPLGMATYDADPFAIGNPRAENVVLRKGRSTRVSQPTGGQATLDLGDDAYVGSEVSVRISPAPAPAPPAPAPAPPLPPHTRPLAPRTRPAIGCLRPGPAASPYLSSSRPTHRHPQPPSQLLRRQRVASAQPCDL